MISRQFERPLSGKADIIITVITGDLRAQWDPLFKAMGGKKCFPESSHDLEPDTTSILKGLFLKFFWEN